MGSDMMRQLAEKTGLPLDALANQLAEHLPHVVDGLTPTGEVPPAGGNEQLLAAGASLLKGRFGIG
jgi:uncharacterized protein YidB (DUF937 family)